MGDHKRKRRPDRNQEHKRSLLLNAELGAGLAELDNASKEALSELDAMVQDCSPEDADERLAVMGPKANLLETIARIRRSDAMAKEEYKFSALARFQIPIRFAFPEDMKPRPDVIDIAPAADPEPVDEQAEAEAAADLAKMREEGKA